MTVIPDSLKWVESTVFHCIFKLFSDYAEDKCKVLCRVNKHGQTKGCLSMPPSILLFILIPKLVPEKSINLDFIKSIIS